MWWNFAANLSRVVSRRAVLLQTSGCSLHKTADRTNTFTTDSAVDKCLQRPLDSPKTQKWHISDTIFFQSLTTFYFYPRNAKTYLFFFDARFDLQSLLRFSVNDNDELIYLLTGFPQLRLQQGQIALHHGHLRGGVRQPVQTTLVAFFRLQNFVSLLGQENFVGLDQLEVRCGCDVVVPLQLDPVLPAELDGGGVEIFAHFRAVCFLIPWQIDVLEEALRDGTQRVFRPALEPVNCATVDDWGKFSQTCPAK